MITYLLGAGASAGSVPILRNLIPSIKHEKIVIDKEFRPTTKFVNIHGYEYSYYDLKEELVKDFEWLIKEAEKHQSIDTFAKKLFIQNETKALKLLKTLLSIYFIVIQSKCPADIRYDSFFASILGSNASSFPDKLRILSWNYDYQLEKAYSEYYRDDRIEACQTMLNVYSKNIKGPAFNPEKFGLIKLNGTATLIKEDEKAFPISIIDKPSQEYSNELVENLLKHYALLHHYEGTKEKRVSSLSFAWEDFPDLNNKVYSSIGQTEVLVVIGYSFPFFNREIDRAIIGKMSHLKKVYFQAPDAEDLRERFLAIREDIDYKNLHLRKDIMQFAFPNEL